MNLEKNHFGNGIRYMGFNQDASCFACATDIGFQIFNADPLKVREKFVFEAGGGLGIVEMLFRCNYLALVGGGVRPLYRNSTVLVWDDLTKKPAIFLDQSAPVKAVRLRRDRIVVVMEGVIKVFSFEQTPQQLHVFETSQNPQGLCVLCPSSSNPLLGFPARRSGQVHIVDLAKTQKDVLKISAHEGTVTCMSMNLQGTLLATASDRGTLIRVFDTAQGLKTAELRRGTNQAHIYCINFNKSSTQLVVSSDHGTIHVFRLDSQLPRDGGSSAAANIIPKYFTSNWSFCKMSLPQAAPCICAFGTDENSVIVVCADGNYYKFLFNGKGEYSRDMCNQFLEITNQT